MNKILLFLSCCGLSLLSSAQTTFTVDDVTYQITGENRVGISDVVSSVTSFDIPATITNDGVTYEVKTIEKDAFKWSKATMIVLPNSIDSIKHNAFGSASSLVSITLPENLKYLGDYAFSSCQSLPSINIPDGVSEIGASAFFTCLKLTNIKLPANLKKIGKSAFYKCPFVSIEIPASCDTIEGKAFLFCDKLESFTFPTSLKKLGEGVFNGCKSLQSVSLPEGLTEIGDELFVDCAALTSLNIPASVKSIGFGIIGRSGVSTLTVDANSEYFQVIDNIVYNKNKSLLYLAPTKGKTKVSVQSATTGIWGGAFWGSDLEEITINNKMRAIDDYAFCQSNLSKINFPNSLVYMGEQALAGTKLTQITLPENMPTIHEALLAQCENLTSITIPSGVTVIANRAFWMCKALTEVKCLGTIPPVLIDWYEEDDHPFGYVTRSNVSMVVPAGKLSVYKASDWKYVFSNMSDTAPAILEHISTTPEYDESVKTFDGLSLIFDEATTIVKSSPDVEMRKDNILSGTKITVMDEWRAITSGSDKKTIRIFPCDYDMYTTPVTLEDDAYYYVSIPAGIVKNSAGNLNEKTVLRIIGGVASGINIHNHEGYYVTKYDNSLEITLNGSSKCDVLLYNESGMLIQSQSNVLDYATFSNLDKGLYIIAIKVDGKTISFKAMM